jgi:hypothetical protein
MITSAIIIQTHTGTPNTFLFRSASKLPLGLLGDDGATPAGELGLEGVPGTAPGELGVPGLEGKPVGGWRL